MLALFGATTAVPTAFADTVRRRQRTPVKRTAIAKKPTKRTVTKPRAASKPVTQEPSIHVQGHENVFRALDRNSSGFISRDEWPGSKMAFDAVDKNKNGRISLDELRSKED